MSAIISTVTAQHWGLLNQPELQSFQKMYDEDLLSEGIVFFPAALENYYAKLGMSKTEFSFMRNLLQLWAKNDKKSWFTQDQIEQLFGKSRRQVQRDARKLAKEGFIIISEWDDSNNDGMHCIHYDCTPFLQMISQLVRVNRQRTTYKEDIAMGKSEDAVPTYSIVPVQDLSLATLTNRFFEKRHAAEAQPLSADMDMLSNSEVGVEEATVTNVAIKSNHIHMPRGKRLSHASFVDMCDPTDDESGASEPQTRNNTSILHHHSVANQPAFKDTQEPITEPNLAAQKATSNPITPALQHKIAQLQAPHPQFQPKSNDQQLRPRPANDHFSHDVQRPSAGYRNPEAKNMQPKLAQRAPLQATTQPERDLARQKNLQQTRLPLLSSVVMREVSQAFRDHTPQESQRDATIIFRRLLLINRIQDDLAIKNPDQYFSNLIKNVFQETQVTSQPQFARHASNEPMDNFMSALNHAAFNQFEQIKIMRHQRTDVNRRYQQRAENHAAQQPQPIQIAQQEIAQPFEPSSRVATASTNQTRVQQRARNFPTGEELVALAHHMHVTMTDEEANEIEIGAASEQLLVDIQDAILLSYDQQPDVNYA